MPAAHVVLTYWAPRSHSGCVLKGKKMIHRNAWAAALIGASAITFSPAIAGEQEDALIAKVVDAYGGDKLTSLKSIRIQDSYKNAFPGQGYTPGFVEFTALAQDAQLDLVNKRGSVEAWASNWNGAFHVRTVTDDDGVDTINYLSNTYQPAAFADYYAAYGAVIRVTDTLLAFELSNNAESAEYAGASTYLGQPHEMITFEMPSSPPVTLHINADTGLISQMTRATGFGALSYQFRDHAKSGGVTYARDFEFFVGPDVNILTLSRDVTVNRVRSNSFSIDRGISEEPARVDTSEMTVEEIAEGVHHVGTGNAYTVFVDAGDYLIAAGGYAGLSNRLEAYRETIGNEKPLQYQIVTHHHTDHLGGMGDALELGVTFVVPQNAVDNLRTAAGGEITDDRLQILDEKRTIGPVEVYDIWTSHAESYGLVYIPSSKAVFQVDHYNGVYEDAPSPAGIGAVTLKDAIARLGLDVETVLSGHGRIAESWANFEAAVANYDPSPCPTGRAICASATN